MKRTCLALGALALVAGSLSAQSGPPAPQPFHWHDDYTEYHLLEPSTHSFAIVYFLNQRREGLDYLLNMTRAGSEGSGIGVTDPRTGQPLKFDYMTGAELAAEGVQGRLVAGEHYIRVRLARPVPAGGEGRARIEKTYKDEGSYTSEDGGATIGFVRSLGIGRNAIVLPAGYSLVSSNVAASAVTLADGRLRLSFENVNGYASDVRIVAARRELEAHTSGSRRSTAADFTKTLYELDSGGTVTFRHEMVRAPDGGRVTVPAGFAVRDAQGRDLDTGAPLTLRSTGSGAEVRVEDDAATVHIRITGTLETYERANGTLRWARALHEPRAMIVLPPGYAVVEVSAPVTTGTLPDGRAYLHVVNRRAPAPLTVEIRGALERERVRVLHDERARE